MAIKERLTSDFYQKIRLVDIFLLAPAMIYISLSDKKNLILRNFLLASGVATIIFNYKNYQEIEKIKRWQK